MRALLLAVALACGCCPTPQAPPGAETGASPPAARCALACEGWRRLGCAEGAVSPSGATCEDDCVAGLRVSVEPHEACVHAAASCQAARSCRLGRAPGR